MYYGMLSYLDSCIQNLIGVIYELSWPVSPQELEKINSLKKHYEDYTKRLAEVSKPIGDLTDEQVAQIYRNGGDSWKTAEVVSKFLQVYAIKKRKFIEVNLPFPTYEQACIYSLLVPEDIMGLWSYCKRIPKKGTYLEVGSFVGGSLMLAHEATKDLEVDLVCIDPHIHNDINHIQLGITSAQVFEENTLHIPKDWRRERSDVAVTKFADNSIDLLFIDGSHTYEECKSDLELYWPKVKRNGHMIVHDFCDNFPGVARAVEEFIKRNSPYGANNYSLIRWATDLNESSLVCFHK